MRAREFNGSYTGKPLWCEINKAPPLASPNGDNLGFGFDERRKRQQQYERKQKK